MAKLHYVVDTGVGVKVDTYNNLFVYVPVDTKTGEVDMEDIRAEHRLEGLNKLAPDWEWRKFKLVLRQKDDIFYKSEPPDTWDVVHEICERCMGKAEIKSCEYRDCNCEDCPCDKMMIVCPDCEGVGEMVGTQGIFY